MPSGNILVAAQAAQFVRSSMRFGAGNKREDIQSSSGKSTECVDMLRKDFDQFKMLNQSANFLQKLEANAARAAAMGCGNCGEQVALAFDYLRKRGIRPLEHMSLSNGDHAFLVLDRLPRTDPGKPATWNREAIICDPWRESNAYMAAQFSLFWPGGIPQLDFRLD